MRYTWSSHTLASQSLNGRRVYRIVLPDEPWEGQIPLLVLLHGVHGSETDWIDHGNLTTQMEELMNVGQIGQMAVLTPSDGLAGIGTGYLNWEVGEDSRYEDYLLKDVIGDVERKWNVGGTRSKRAVGGLSMGGFAAIRWALSRPELFSSCSSLSGLFDARELETLVGPNTYSKMFAMREDIADACSPLFMPIMKENVPNILFDCGMGDRYIANNRLFHNRLKSYGIPHHYQEYDGGHTWDYWRTHLAKHLWFHYEAMTVHS